jgi:hypothetical protein
MPKKITTIIVGLILVTATSLIIEDNDYFSHKPTTQDNKEIKVKPADTAEALRSTMIYQLHDLKSEYIKTNMKGNEKEALALLILYHASSFDLNQPDIPVELRRFIEDLRVEHAGKLIDTHG